MEKNMHHLADRIRILREQTGLTQLALAKELSLTRASVNAWEMGLSVPSTPFIVELANLFHVSTDYLLGLDENETIRTDGLSQQEISVLINTIECFKSIRRESSRSGN